MTILDKCNAFPPCLCRLVARKGLRPLTHREIAKASNLSHETVSRLSLKNDWSGVKIDVIVRFAAACGVNHMALQRPRFYVRRSRLRGLRQGTKGQQKFYDRIFKLAKAA